MDRLDIFILRECQSCQEALRVAAVVDGRFTDLVVRVIDLADPALQRPGYIFAVPTYALNGAVIHLGNPDANEFIRQLESELASAKT